MISPEYCVKKSTVIGCEFNLIDGAFYALFHDCGFRDQRLITAGSFEACVVALKADWQDRRHYYIVCVVPSFYIMGNEV